MSTVGPRGEPSTHGGTLESTLESSLESTQRDGKNWGSGEKKGIEDQGTREWRREGPTDSFGVRESEKQVRQVARDGKWKRRPDLGTSVPSPISSGESRSSRFLWGPHILSTTKGADTSSRKNSVSREDKKRRKM